MLYGFHDMVLLVGRSSHNYELQELPERAGLRPLRTAPADSEIC